MDDSLIFYALAILSVIFSLLLISQKQVVKATVYLLFHLCFTAGIYAYLGAEIVAVMQIILYTTAILALFIFARKLSNFELTCKEELIKPGKFELISTSLLIIGMIVFSWAGFFSKELGSKTSSHLLEEISIFDFSLQIFSRFKWPLTVSFLLFVMTMVACKITSKNSNKSSSSAEGGPLGPY
ncbi:MAG: NADH-quinone oxidoreductase subunit J [Oligoflexales bacterium]